MWGGGTGDSMFRHGKVKGKTPLEKAHRRCEVWKSVFSYTLKQHVLCYVQVLSYVLKAYEPRQVKFCASSEFKLWCGAFM